MLINLKSNQIIKQLDPILNILRAFIFYRPDVGYVKGVMPNIVKILLTYLDEYTSFSCFVNLLHSHHFLQFFRGDGVREIGWRISFFDSHFARRLPLVFRHFKAIDLVTEVFIINWFLDLFTSSFSDISCISRIWDNFLLEGELFLYKCALAILDFF